MIESGMNWTFFHLLRLTLNHVRAKMNRDMNAHTGIKKREGGQIRTKTTGTDIAMMAAVQNAAHRAPYGQ